MVNAVLPPSKTKLRCREIAEPDIEMIAQLLARGFPGRRPAYWITGLKRMTTRDVPAGYPRFGYMMESDGKPVGAILQLYSSIALDRGERAVRCNLSSWYVEPAFRGYASLLISYALKHKGITYTNISPAPHTWPILEAQGFKRYCDGQFLAIPALSSADLSVRIEEVSGSKALAAHLRDEERAMLLSHAQFGCTSLICHTPDGDFPFVFLPYRAKAGRIPLACVRLIYCRDMADFVRFAGSLGRFLLRRGAMFALLDANGPVAGLRGVYFETRGRKYFKGPNPPRHGDLALTELVVFGP